MPDGEGGFIYKVEASAISSKDNEGQRAELLRIIEPISGEVTITKIEPAKDRSGRVLTYQVWVQRE